MGKFLNPVSGFWQNAEGPGTPPLTSLKLSGLKNSVTIKFDDRRIPHIFATNNHDLYFAQGYITARDRLWQMDLEVRSAAGRLSEIIGQAALPTDLYHRRMGMVFAAENTLKEIMKDPDSRLAINAYCAGVNAYIRQLNTKNLPIEYKLLDYNPEEWRPINSAFLLKLMSETLAGSSNELAMSETLQRLGWQKTEDLFPNRQSGDDPVIPAGTPWNFKALKVPERTTSTSPNTGISMLTKPKIEGIGSNNWAVAGSKTQSGFPILANDPHLNLTYPSIWYQVQTTAPGINANGVSFPGAPFIIIGFNNCISWGLTNVDADVLDWYKIRFRDKTRNQYWYNGKWCNVIKRLETIRIRGQQTLTDTVRYTVHGPIVYDNLSASGTGPNFVPAGSALRWIAHDPSNEFKTFYMLNRARSYADYRNALTFYTAPAQNFVFASTSKDVGITVDGKIPLKNQGQGKYILNGGDTASNWHGFIPFNQLPAVKNPERGFVSSANQSSTDNTYPYYINWRFSGYERGKRINERLAGMGKITIDSMRMLQLDDYNLRARDILPSMLSTMTSTGLNDEPKLIYNKLSKWSYRYTLQSIEASFFERWWLKFYWSIWARDFVHGTHPFYPPSADRTAALLIRQPNSSWFDDPKTTNHETAADVLRSSYLAAFHELEATYGKLGSAWQWGKVKKFEIRHLAGLEGFGSGNIATPGSASTINAIIDGHGPSWRMIVEMGPRVRAYGILPGGESGNPGSGFYDDMLSDWENGRLPELLFLSSPNETSNRIISTLTLNK